jgi:diguanylate cyclase (GGDEF)-like protein
VTTERRTVSPLSAQVHALASLTSRIADLVSRDRLLDLVAEAALELLGADSVHLGLVDRPRGRLRLVVNAGDVAEWEMVVPEEELYLLADYPQLVQTDSPSAVWRAGVDDVDLRERDRSLLRSLGVSQAMSVPVLVAGQVWGELFFTRTSVDVFDDHEQSVAVVLAGLLGASVARLDGQDRLQELAYTDSLTGLGNRRRADEQLDAWASDPEHATQVAVVLCDVNNLKHVNDTLGHSTGDRLIRDLADLVASAAGRLKQGLAARIGGDEFLIACVCDSLDVLHGVVAELTVASRAIPLGSGLSCGVAWAGDLARREATTSEEVSALLRLADVDQYQQKRIARQARAVTGGAEPLEKRTFRPEVVTDGGGDDYARFTTTTPESLADQTSALLRRLESAPASEVVDRLVDVAATLCAATGSAAWWLSSVRSEENSVVARRCGTPRAPGLSDGQWPDVVLDPTVYRLSDFPATRAISTGGSFSVDTFHGDPAERRFLVQTGFASMIAAAGSDASGATWLIEVFGDALTTELPENRALLEALMSAALRS